jgi:hypothetical protein
VFYALKAAIMTVLVLALPDFTKPFVVECDASTHGSVPCSSRTSTRWCSSAAR